MPRPKAQAPAIFRHLYRQATDKFGPRLLHKMRSDWVKSGKKRQYCNRLTNAVVRLFKWATAQELVDISTHQRLKTLEPLRIGESDAPETKPIVPANLDDVPETAKHLPPQLKAVSGYCIDVYEFPFSERYRTPMDKFLVRGSVP